MFTQHFIAGKRQKKTSLHLMSISQGENESLKDFIKRFNSESFLIPDLQDNIAYTSLLAGLRPGKFKWGLLEDKDSTFTEAMRRAEKYIQAADICGSTSSQNKKRNNDNPHERGKGMRRSMDDKEDRDDYKYNANRRGILWR